jgi:hypothetical protein
VLGRVGIPHRWGGDESFNGAPVGVEVRAGGANGAKPRLLQ